jgi:hypothetical protein
VLALPAYAHIATEVGAYELKGKGGKVLDHGKYIVVWRREGERWKLLRDMFSTNVPPAPTARSTGGRVSSDAF